MTTRLPLLIDVHAHTRDFNQQHKGTFETETKAALAGGVGTVLAMPNTEPPIVSHEDLVNYRRLAAGNIYCDVGFHFGTLGNNTLEFPHVWPLVYGLKVYLSPTTGCLNIDLAAAKRAFKAWNSDKPILVHAEGRGLLDKIINLTRKYRRRLHVCHVSLAEEVEAIRQAKKSGVKITAEVCPHHLIFTQEDLPGLGSCGIMKPPLGGRRDVEALWQGIKGYVIDMIATDHAPHSPEEKASKNPPFGVIAEPFFPVIWAQCLQRRLNLEDLAFLTHFTPARIFQIDYSHSDSYMEVDLDAEFVLDRSMLHSKAGRSPYESTNLRGKIVNAFLHGEQVIRDGEIIAKRGQVI